MVYSVSEVLTKQFTLQTPKQKQKKKAENTLKYSGCEQKILNRKAINEKKNG